MEKATTKSKPKQTPEQLYKAGYAAFEKGNYRKAIYLAGKCLLSADRDSYWYAGALALRCWAANWDGDAGMAIRDAYVLLAMDAGDDKMWFDGTALLNLGLIRRRGGDNGEAEVLFQFASERYAAYVIESDKPSEWLLIRDMFAAACFWAAQNETGKLDELAKELPNASSSSADTAHVRQAVDLYLRAARGENVGADARAATSKGVSRTFVALLLI